MPVKLSKWGNSLGLRISRELAERAALEPGDYMFLRLLDSGEILIRPVKPKDVPAGYAIPQQLTGGESTRDVVQEAISEPW